MSSIIADVKSAATTAQGEETQKDSRTQEEVDQDNALADRLSLIIEDANEKIVPICEMIRKASILVAWMSCWVFYEGEHSAYWKHGG